MPLGKRGGLTRQERIDREEYKLTQMLHEEEVDNAPSILCLGSGVESLEIIKQIKALGYRPIIVGRGYGTPGEKWANSFPKVKRGSGHQDEPYSGVGMYTMLVHCSAISSLSERTRVLPFPATPNTTAAVSIGIGSSV